MPQLFAPAVFAPVVLLALFLSSAVEYTVINLLFAGRSPEGAHENYNGFLLIQGTKPF